MILSAVRQQRIEVVGELRGWLAERCVDLPAPRELLERLGAYRVELLTEDVL